jgi:hypothetical protein
MIWSRFSARLWIVIVAGKMSLARSGTAAG